MVQEHEKKFGKHSGGLADRVVEVFPKNLPTNRGSSNSAGHALGQLLRTVQFWNLKQVDLEFEYQKAMVSVSFFSGTRQRSEVSLRRSSWSVAFGHFENLFLRSKHEASSDRLFALTLHLPKSEQ